jgi:hypothetical protein
MSPRSEKRRTGDLLDNEAAGSISQTDTVENQPRPPDRVETTTARSSRSIDDEEAAQNTDDEIQGLSFHHHRTAVALSPVPSPSLPCTMCSTSVRSQMESQRRRKRRRSNTQQGIQRESVFRRRKTNHARLVSTDHCAHTAR